MVIPDNVAETTEFPGVTPTLIPAPPYALLVVDAEVKL